MIPRNAGPNQPALEKEEKSEKSRSKLTNKMLKLFRRSFKKRNNFNVTKAFFKASKITFG